MSPLSTCCQAGSFAAAVKQVIEQKIQSGEIKPSDAARVLATYAKPSQARAACILGETALSGCVALPHSCAFTR